MIATAQINAIFLSTPSARRATAAVDVVGHIDVISIHALREEGDPVPQFFQMAGQRFLSTPSARRATGDALFRQNGFFISIHALREEGDQ